MANNILFNKLCKYETLKMGWYLAQNDTRNDFVSDPIGYSDFAFQLSDRLHYLADEIKNDRYTPKHLIRIDIPKSGLSVRPGSVLPIEDMVVLHACVLLLAPKLDKKLKDNVYSYRLREDYEEKLKKRKSLFTESEPEFPFLKKRTIVDFDPFEQWYEGWTDFENTSSKVYTEEGYTFLTKTDITSYFENIDLSALEDLIRSYLGKEDRFVHFLFRVLRSWTRSTSTGTPIGRGIPQGNEISSFMGNFFLIKVDEALHDFCKKNDAKWFRYVDDIKVFSKDKHVARRVVFEINNSLRSLYLNIQGSKTEILYGNKLKKEIDNQKIQKVNEVFDNIKNHKDSDSKTITKELSKLKIIISFFRIKKTYSDVSIIEKNDHLLLRRLMTLFGILGRTHFKKISMESIKQLPDLKLFNSSLIYLTRLGYQEHNELLSFFIEMLENGDMPIPYQNALILQCLLRIHPDLEVSKKVPSQIRSIVLNSTKEWIVAQKSLEVIMVYPYRTDYLKPIVENYILHNHHLVRRAALQLVVRCEREYAQSMIRKCVYDINPNISCMALYLLRFYDEVSYSREQLKQIKNGNQDDVAFQRNLHKLYAMGMITEESFLEIFKQYLNSIFKILKSERLKWHFDHIIKQ